MAELATNITSDIFVFHHERALGLVLKQHRSTQELCIRTGKGSQSVSNYLNGKSDPPASWVGILAGVLGLTPDGLYCRVTDSIEVVDVEPWTKVRVLSRRERRNRISP